MRADGSTELIPYLGLCSRCMRAGYVLALSHIRTSPRVRPGSLSHRAHARPTRGERRPFSLLTRWSLALSKPALASHHSTPP